MDEISNLTLVYKYENGKLNKNKEVDFSFPFGAGEIYSTAKDMSYFDKALHLAILITKESIEKKVVMGYVIEK